ncbi:MAG: Nif3-like dinuclear metal center hexameric protein [Cyclobacteriaceae bacterium]
MAKIRDITNYLETIAPLTYQESYDNSGLIVGDVSAEVSGVLISLDCTEPVVEEAIEQKCNVIIAHHPILFKPIKKLTGQNYVERTLLQAIKNEIAIYAIHTNLDNVRNGVNSKLGQKLGLTNCSILRPEANTLSKLVTYVPSENTSAVLKALGEAGAGQIGNYQECSFRVEGTGTFRPNSEANPHKGVADQLEEVIENRVEVIFPSNLSNTIMEALNQAHPYEEVAFYLQAVANQNQDVGSGLVGHLPKAFDPTEFLNYLKETMQLSTIRHTALISNKIHKVAVCGGAGSFLLKAALAQDCQAFISADFKYHEFFDADNQIVIADVGHYESEVFTKDLIFELLQEKFSNFALRLSKVVTNPVRYY